MVKIFKYIEWLLKFCPSVKYTGYYCGHCNKWHDVPFEIPTYKSWGFFYDTYVTAYPNGCQPVEVKPKRDVKCLFGYHKYDGAEFICFNHKHLITPSCNRAVACILFCSVCAKSAKLAPLNTEERQVVDIVHFEPFDEYIFIKYKELGSSIIIHSYCIPFPKERS